MKYAWIENDHIRDIAPGDPFEFYHPDVAKFYDTQVPDDAENGDGWVNGGLVKPVYVPPVPPPRTWGISNIRAGLTLGERVKWDNDKTDTIKTVKIEFAQPLLLAQATEMLQFLVDSGDISAASMQRILA